MTFETAQNRVMEWRSKELVYRYSGEKRISTQIPGFSCVQRDLSCWIFKKFVDSTAWFSYYRA